MENKGKKAKYGYRRFSGSRGTITVFVTLIMIPVILLNAFIVDMTRVKLYGDQAVMAADNVAEAALTNYDNLLKEMYGLFAMSQDESAIAALNQIEEFVKYSSFDPNSNTMLGESYDGFMPYSTAEIEFGELTYPDRANLADDAVLQTQIGDFMRFRIVQESMQAMNGTSLDDAMELLDVLNQASDQDEDSRIIDKKVDFDNAVSNLYVKLYEYYMFMYGYARYPAYLEGVNEEIQRVVSDCKSIYDSDQVRTYYEYAGLSDEERTEAKWLLYNPVTEGYRIRDSIYDRRDDFSDQFYNAVYISDDIFKNAELLKAHDISLSYPRKHPTSYMGWYIGDIRDFGDDFVQVSDELDAAITRYENAKANIQTVLAEKDANDPFRTKIEEEIADLEDFIGIFNGTDCGYSREDFTNLSRYLYDNSSRDAQYEEQYKEIIDEFEYLGDRMRDAEDINWDDYSSIRINYDNYMNFLDITSYNNLYEKLSLEFKNIGTEEKEKFEKREDEAKDKSDEKVKQFNNESFPEARDVPAGFSVSANSGGSGAFDPISSIKEVASYFSGNLGDASVRFMLKYYTISYDFGMFSSRVSRELVGKSADELKDKDVVFESLTGVTYDGNANYLYGAELEYILAGYQSSLENLKTSRNMIVGFRTIMNYKCTYTIGPLNDAFGAVRVAGNGIFPGLGYIVEQALRLSITIIETTSDWDELKKGGSVMFNKTEIGDLWIAGTITSFLNPNELNGADTTTKSNGLKLSYNQYLRIMIMLLESNDVILERTRDLITLNMNLVETDGVGAGGVLTKQIFFADKAYTAVSVDCSVHSDFAVMPQSFLNQLAGPDTVDEINDYGSSFFKFTVVRGY